MRVAKSGDVRLLSAVTAITRLCTGSKCSIVRIDESIVRTDESVARTDESVARTDESMARTDESMARTD